MSNNLFQEKHSSTANRVRLMLILN